jgi:hypothetical protein
LQRWNCEILRRAKWQFPDLEPEPKAFFIPAFPLFRPAPSHHRFRLSRESKIKSSTLKKETSGNRVPCFQYSHISIFAFSDVNLLIIYFLSDIRPRILSKPGWQYPKNTLTGALTGVPSTAKFEKPL